MSMKHGRAERTAAMRGRLDMTTGMSLDVTTGYVIEPCTETDKQIVPFPANQISLVVSKGLEGQLLLDPNACGLDSFGDPRICTKIAISVHHATLSLVEEHEGKMLFAIEAEGYKGPELRLAMLPRRGTGGGPLVRLLVMKDDGSIGRLVNMERRVRSGAA